MSVRHDGARPIRVSEDEAEEVARQATVESGLDDRPRCDPRTLAVSYLGLRLAPLPGMRPRLESGIVWYPSDAPPDAIAYYVAHECGHELVRTERLRGDVLERVCSRIGCALLLPRRAFVRDVRATRGDVDALRALWPLASREVIRRRLREVGYGTAHAALMHSSPAAASHVTPHPPQFIGSE